MADDFKSQNDEYIGALCPACGLCCTGVLFGYVALQPGDDARELKDLGIVLEGKGRKSRFRQPCGCFDGRHCGVYEKRPRRCRAFECRLLQRVGAGELAVGSALESIRCCRRQAERVRELLRHLGEKDKSRPLNRRYSKVMAEPIDLGDESGRVEMRSELMLAVRDLGQILERDFLLWPAL